MIQTIRKAWGIPELRKKIIFTALILLIFRIGNAIPVPYVNTGLLGTYMDQLSTTVLSLYNVMSGGAFAQATVFALGVQPYINSSIIIQLLTIAIPSLGRMAQEGGEEGKKKIQSITRYATVAIAIIQDVRRKGALTAATTHYAELKTFAMTTAGVENASCEFDVQTLRPTYRLLIGIPGKSNAFAISRRLGLDESVIEDAKAQMDSESVRFEDVLTQLEEKRQRLEKAQGEADRLWRQREEDARKARTFREQMEKAKDNARTKGEAEARRIVQQAQRQADQVFAELDELRKQQQRSDYQAVNDRKSDIRRRLNEAETALHQRDEDTEPVPAPSRPIAVGDTVELAGVRTGAAVLAVNGDGTLLLQAGKMKMTVKAAQVRLLETAEEIEKKKKQSAAAQQRSGPAVSINTGARASAELDIRGLETLEAESVVENYLDAASRSKLGTVTIIHGKGTGALRAAVHQLLKKNKQVKSFRLGRYGEGEAGVTVVELK